MIIGKKIYLLKDREQSELDGNAVDRTYFHFHIINKNGNDVKKGKEHLKATDLVHHIRVLSKKWLKAPKNVNVNEAKECGNEYFNIEKNGDHISQLYLENLKQLNEKKK